MGLPAGALRPAATPRQMQCAAPALREPRPETDPMKVGDP